MPDSYFISDKQHSPSNKYPSDGSQNLLFNDFLNSILPSNTHPLSAAATHHFSSKGKQLRAKIALSAGEIFGADNAACHVRYVWNHNRCGSIWHHRHECFLRRIIIVRVGVVTHMIRLPRVTFCC